MGFSVSTRSPGPASGAGSAIGARTTGGGAFTGGGMSTGGAGTGTAIVASVSLGFARGAGVVAPSSMEPSIVPVAGSTGTMGDRSLGGSGGDQLRAGGGAFVSAAGDWMGGNGTGSTGSTGVAVTRFGGSGVATGARKSRAGSAAAGASPRDATGLGAAMGAGRFTGSGEAGSPLVGFADPGTGNTSSVLMPGVALTSQTMSPSRIRWNESEPDMQKASGMARDLSSGAGDGPLGSPWRRGPGLDRAGHDG